MVASYQASKVMTFDLETGQLVMSLDSGTTYGEHLVLVTLYLLFIRTKVPNFIMLYVCLMFIASSVCLSADGTPSTQINKVVSHPTLPLIVSAHEDKYIRFYDVNSGKSLVCLSVCLSVC